MTPQKPAYGMIALTEPRSGRQPGIYCMFHVSRGLEARVNFGGFFGAT
jgi:hypothetical protein